MISNDELERTWKETIVVFLKIRFRQLPLGAKVNHDKRQNSQPPCKGVLGTLNVNSCCVSPIRRSYAHQTREALEVSLVATLGQLVFGNRFIMSILCFVCRSWRVLDIWFVEFVDSIIVTATPHKGLRQTTFTYRTVVISALSVPLHALRTSPHYYRRSPFAQAWGHHGVRGLYVSYTYG
jgi:hypothetical protein